MEVLKVSDPHTSLLWQILTSGNRLVGSLGEPLPLFYCPFQLDIYSVSHSGSKSGDTKAWTSFALSARNQGYSTLRSGTYLRSCFDNGPAHHGWRTKNLDVATWYWLLGIWTQFLHGPLNVFPQSLTMPLWIQDDPTPARIRQLVFLSTSRWGVITKSINPRWYFTIWVNRTLLMVWSTESHTFCRFNHILALFPLVLQLRCDCSKLMYSDNIYIVFSPHPRSPNSE